MNIARLTLQEVLLTVFCVATVAGCAKPAVPTPEPGIDVKPSPVAPDRGFTDGEFWSALASHVERGHVADTDEVIRIAKQAKQSGYLSDIGGIDTALPTAAATNEVISEANRSRVANSLRTLK